MNDLVRGTLGVLLAVGVFALVIMGAVGGCGAFKGWQRGQARANARNQVALTKIQVQNQYQYASVIRAHNQVVKDQAYQRWLEATGVRAAQDEIAKTLTDRYLQYEAIKAQEAVATSGQNNTVVYVPTGNMGVPLVQTPPLKGAK